MKKKYEDEYARYSVWVCPKQNGTEIGWEISVTATSKTNPSHELSKRALVIGGPEKIFSTISGFIASLRDRMTWILDTIHELEQMLDEKFRSGEEVEAEE